MYVPLLIVQQNKQITYLINAHGNIAPYLITFEKRVWLLIFILKIIWNINYSIHLPISILPNNCSNIIISKQKFKVCKSSNSEDTAIDIIFYSELSNHLVVIKDNMEANKCVNTWPVFIWYCLKNKNTHNKYDAKIWKSLPKYGGIIGFTECKSFQKIIMALNLKILLLFYWLYIGY